MESIMKSKALMTAATLSLGISATASAAVLQEFTGGTVTQGNDITLVTTSTDTNDWIDTYSPSTASGTLYYKFDINVTNNAGETGSGGFFTALQLFNGTAERIGVGNSWAATDYGYFGGPGANAEGALSPTQEIVLNQTETFVVRIDFVSGGNDTARIYFNPTSSDEGAQTVYATTTNNFGFDNVRIRAGNGTGSATYSDIVFATTFAEAVPEPGSLAILGLGALLIARRRRD